MPKVGDNMPDRAVRETERIRADLLRSLSRLYNSANRQIADEVDFEALWLDDEEATERERLRYAQKNGLGDAVAVVIAILLLTNERAIQAINSSLDGVYGLNFEAMADIITDQSGVNLRQPGFNLDKLLDKYTRRAYHRQRSEPKITKRVEQAFRQALKQGMGIKDMARHLQKTTIISRTSAYATARTETFRIANDGRNAAFERAAAAGLHIKKVWHHSHASKDPRRWHLAMEGEARELDEPFSNGLMLPCEAGAPAEEVINCSCYMLPEVID